MNKVWKIFNRSKFVTFTIIFGLLVIFKKAGHKNDFYCIEDIQKGETQCRPTCEPGYFGLPGMDSCRPLLKCDRIQRQVHALERIQGGEDSQIYVEKAKWKTYHVLRSTLKEEIRKWRDNYKRILTSLKILQSSHKVTQLIGFCGFSFVTEFHPLGSPLNYEHLLQSPALQKHNNIRTRLATCISYIEAIHYLHNSPIGTLVLVETPTIEEYLSQMSLTQDLGVVIHDVGRLKEVEREGGLLVTDYNVYTDITSFTAPEQRPGEDYDERADIWKIPNVCMHFLGNEFDTVKSQLSDINRRCKSENPSQRPSIGGVLNVYKQVLEKLSESLIFVMPR